MPNEIAYDGDNFITALPGNNIPNVENAVQLYHSRGGQLRHDSHFGVDPLASRPDLIMLRDQWLFQSISSNADIFSDIVSGTGNLFKMGILKCIDITIRFAELV